MNSIWIARDKGGALSLFTKKPSRFEGIWKNKSEDEISGYCKIPFELFPELTWESEPIEFVVKKRELSHCRRRNRTMNRDISACNSCIGKTRSQSALRESKALEKRVDDEISRV